MTVHSHPSISPLFSGPFETPQAKLQIPSSAFVSGCYTKPILSRILQEISKQQRGASPRWQRSFTGMPMISERSPSTIRQASG
jgi:hypothetical protein